MQRQLHSALRNVCNCNAASHGRHGDIWIGVPVRRDRERDRHPRRTSRFKPHSLVGSLGYVPPAEHAEMYDQLLKQEALGSRRLAFGEAAVINIVQHDFHPEASEPLEATRCVSPSVR